MNSINLFTTRTSLIVALALARFVLLPDASAVVPPPDGGYPGGNTAEGTNALFSQTTGEFNTAIGWQSLKALNTATFNTAVGAGTLALNTGDDNTATGAAVLLFNTSGNFNTANGAFALFNNTEGGNNTAIGFQALFSNINANHNTATGFQTLLSNTTGQQNTASGAKALLSNTEGNFNTANGDQTLHNNTTGSGNTATGAGALFSNTTGIENTAAGESALLNSTTGDRNIALGALALLSNSEGSFNVGAGFNALAENTTGASNVALGANALSGNVVGSNNTAIGAIAGINSTGDGNVYVGAGMIGVAGESNHTYLRNVKDTSVSGGNSDTVTVDLTTGLLGHSSSSRRYKEDIKAMGNRSNAIYRLKPVTFRYKKEVDGTQSSSFGLIAEQVAEIIPDLVTRNSEGQPEGVHYEQVNAMLLNEFLKEHRKNEEQGATIARQQKQIDALTAGLQKVSAQLELNKSAPQTVLNNR